MGNICKACERLRNELENVTRMRDEFRIENLRKDETIRKLEAELEYAINPPSYVYDAVIEDGVVKMYRMLVDDEFISRRRQKALEKHRREFEMREEISVNLRDFDASEGYDEIDGLSKTV